MKRGQGQWQAYVAGGKDKEEKLERLKEVPEQYRKDTIRHLRTARDLKNSVIDKKKK